MLSSRLFWRLFVSYSLLNLAATVTFVVIVSGWQEEQVVGLVRQRLHDSAALVRSNVIDLLTNGRTEDLQTYVEQLGENIETRITLVAMNGDVLADSKRDGLAQVAEMENHKERLELVQAAASGKGTSERTSPTLGQPMLYVALRADIDGKPAGLVRTALPMTEVRAQVATTRRLIWLVAVLVSIVSMVLTYVVAVRIAKPVSAMTEVAEAISRGSYQQRVRLSQRDELGDLAKSFNRMSRQLEARELQLRESSARLEAVLEGMTEGVIALDDQERILLANAAAGELLGFLPGDKKGRPLLEVLRNHSLHEAIAASRSQQASRRVEFEIGAGDPCVLSVNINFIIDEPSTRFILVLQDVSELRRLESLRQEFVANVSHELKTPLSSIKAYSETLLNGAIHDANNNERFVGRIEEEAGRLHELILNLLSLARIESGQKTFDICSVSVANVVQTCLASYQGVADSKEIRLEAVGDQEDLSVRADEEGLRQILGNLIDNAVKYTPDGGSVTVRWHANDSNVEIEVRDTGIGIAEKNLSRIFERFYRVDKARSRELGGTGLGLSIVKHLVQSFGGTVSATSRSGVGSTFVVRFPRA